MSAGNEIRAEQSQSATATVFFGTRGDAIYRSILNTQSGELSDPEVAAEIKGPGFVTIDKAGERLYSLGNLAETDGNVAAFAIGSDHQTLTPLNAGNTGGGKPTHLSLSQDEKTLLLAHYGGGGIASMPIAADGRIEPPASVIQHRGGSVDKDRQAGPHPHWIGATPDNKFVLVPDLGKDEVVIYRLDVARHTLQLHGAGRVPPGSGPRHLKFHPNNKWVYVMNELGLTVTAFRYNGEGGTLERFQTVVALPESEVKVPSSGSEIRIHPTGKFVYAGLRGHDVIAVFQTDQRTGMLSLIEREPIRGSWPRNFAIDPSGRWLLAAGAESDTVSVFEIDQQTGRLRFTRRVIHVPQSICVTFLGH